MTHDPASIRTTTSRIRHLGAAKSGTRDAWRMRLTNVALLPLGIAFAFTVLSLAGKDEAGVRAQFAHPCTAIFTLLFILASIVHMKLGMQSIIDDYVHTARLKEWSLTANVLFSIGFGVAAIYAVLKLSLA
jgi:succinate dehydrogenase / fumarate reductase, membrane anchor subunit